MNFLGSLGIDIKLLIAQLINFGLLLWILNRFLYKPIVAKIEQDEIELNQAKTQNKELEKQKNDFNEQKRKEKAELKSRTKAILQEAEVIALNLKKETFEKTKSDAKRLIEQSKNKIESLTMQTQKDIFDDLKIKLNVSFQKSFLASLSPTKQKDIQDVLWDNLLELFKKVEIPKPNDSGLVSQVEKLNAKSKNSEVDKDLEKKLEKIFSDKVGVVVLEYVYPLKSEQLLMLEKMIAEKMGFSLVITKKQNKDLINGFRLEISGIIIDSNLFDVIKNALQFSK